MFQLLDLSGILTVFFCGILMSHYTWYNVSEESKVTSRYNWSYDVYILNANRFVNTAHISYDISSYIYRHAFATFSFVSEIFIFLYVGMDALDIEKWKFASNRYLIETLINLGFNYI